jgi:hypothetical protein
MGDGRPMTSTKLMGLGILLMLLGLAMDSQATDFLLESPVATALDVSFGLHLRLATILAYGGLALIVIGFIVGVVGVIRR